MATHENIRWLLQDELPALEKDGVIDAATASRIADHHRDLQPQQQSQRLRWCRILMMIFGALCILTGIYELVQHKWDSLSRLEQLWLTLVPTIISGIASAVFMVYPRKLPKYIYNISGGALCVFASLAISVIRPEYEIMKQEWLWSPIFAGIAYFMLLWAVRADIVLLVLAELIVHFFTTRQCLHSAVSIPLVLVNYTVLLGWLYWRLQHSMTNGERRTAALSRIALAICIITFPGAFANRCFPEVWNVHSFADMCGVLIVIIIGVTMALRAAEAPKHRHFNFWLLTAIPCFIYSIVDCAVEMDNYHSYHKYEFVGYLLPVGIFILALWLLRRQLKLLPTFFFVIFFICAGAMTALPTTENLALRVIIGIGYLISIALLGGSMVFFSLPHRIFSLFASGIAIISTGLIVIMGKHIFGNAAAVCITLCLSGAAIIAATLYFFSGKAPKETQPAAIPTTDTASLPQPSEPAPQPQEQKQ